MGNLCLKLIIVILETMFTWLHPHSWSPELASIIKQMNNQGRKSGFLWFKGTTRGFQNIKIIKLFRALPGPVLHVILPAENERHVNADIVKGHCPVLSHPFPIVVMNKITLEIENVRVIRSYVQVVCHLWRLHFRVLITGHWLEPHSLNTYYNVTLIITEKFNLKS